MWYYARQTLTFNPHAFQGDKNVSEIVRWYNVQGDENKQNVRPAYFRCLHVMRMWCDQISCPFLWINVHDRSPYQCPW